ncbi:MAG: ATP-binding protein [Acetobacteraceae bacterium]|nr:ATP-binding protein [Acetobacteraceae bacterium]
MRLRLPHALRPLKRYLPQSLLGRSLLIMLVPLVVVQLVALQIFYGSDQVIVSRRLATAIAGEIAITAEQFQRYPSAEDRAWAMRMASLHQQLQMHFRPAATLDPASEHRMWAFSGSLSAAMREMVARPFVADWRSVPDEVVIQVQLPDGVLDTLAPRKRLYINTVYLFVIWLVGSAVLLFSVAAMFMSNQVRALRRLAAGAEAFGMGRDHGSIKPEGASEIRQAATAFNRMQERVRRFLGQRTAMLAGVSHDLRTPLTRLRLALALLGTRPELAEDVADMEADIAEMDRMIEGYLAFARGEGSEKAQPTDVSGILEDVAANARRAGADVSLDPTEELVVLLRQDAMRRAITNLVGNASRHARHVFLTLRRPDPRRLEILVDDDGPGIPVDQRETVFRAFASGKKGGTGLGLTIARDIVHAHGGEILLEDSPQGGLRARIVLPI